MQLGLGVDVALRLFGRGAQVGGDDDRVALDLLRRALGDLLAEVEHHDAVRDRHHQLHVVLDEQHAHVALDVDALDELGEVALLGRVRAGGGLVEQQHAGVGAQGAGDLEAALLTVGQRAGQLVGLGREPNLAQQLHAAAGAVAFLLDLPRHPEHRRQRARLLPRLDADLDVLEGGQRREQPDVLERARDAEVVDLVGLLAQDAGEAVAGPGGHEHLPLLRGVDAGERVEQRRLAGAVGPDDGQDLAAGHRHRDVVEADDAAEAQGDVLDVEDEVGLGVGLGGGGTHVTTPLRPGPRGLRRSPGRRGPRARPPDGGPG